LNRQMLNCICKVHCTCQNHQSKQIGKFDPPASYFCSPCWQSLASRLPLKKFCYG
jgi:hypothetical protein